MATTLGRQTLLPLLASSLDGTSDSLLVLADLLEENGSDEVADRARTQELRLQKQLRFVSSWLRRSCCCGSAATTSPTSSIVRQRFTSRTWKPGGN